jgi:hypothetical protein
VWSVSNSYFGWDPRAAFPGKAYVDYIGVGLYDLWWRHPATPAQRWDFLVYWTRNDKPAGLAFWTQYARSLGKPLAIPEWGVVNRTAPMAGGSGGGGDDPYYIRRVHRWIVHHNVAWETYFNTNSKQVHHRLDTGEFPHAAATYLRLFGR